MFGYLTKKVAAIALTLITSFSHVADWSDSVDQVPMSDCNIRTVAMTFSFHNVKRRGDLAGESIKAIDVMKKAASSAKPPSIAIREQLSVAENEAFATARQHKMSIDGVQLIESDYARDMKSIVAMVQVSDASYFYDIQVNETDPNYIYQAVLGMMHLALPSQETTAPKPSPGYSTEIAPHSVEDESLRYWI